MESTPPIPRGRQLVMSDSYWPNLNLRLTSAAFNAGTWRWSRARRLAFTCKREARRPTCKRRCPPRIILSHSSQPSCQTLVRAASHPTTANLGAPGSGSHMAISKKEDSASHAARLLIAATTTAGSADGMRHEAPQRPAPRSMCAVGSPH